MPMTTSPSPTPPAGDALPLPKPFRDPISPEEFREIATATPGRTILLLRHAQRPSIAKDDPTFGEHLGLTEAGEQAALDLGRRLRGLGPSAFAASPMRRTRETAHTVARGMERHDALVHDAPVAGLGGLWITDLAATHRQYAEEGSAAATDRYLRDGRFDGYRSVADGTRRMADWFVTTDFGERHALVFSHDIFIAAFLQGLGVRQFDSAHWVGYLQGAALAQDSDGSWSAFYCVPDKLNFTTAFFQ